MKIELSTELESEYQSNLSQSLGFIKYEKSQSLLDLSNTHEMLPICNEVGNEIVSSRHM